MLIVYEDVDKRPCLSECLEKNYLQNSSEIYSKVYNQSNEN